MHCALSASTVLIINRLFLLNTLCPKTFLHCTLQLTTDNLLIHTLYVLSKVIYSLRLQGSSLFQSFFFFFFPLKLLAFNSEGHFKLLKDTMISTCSPLHNKSNSMESHIAW